MKPYHLCHLLGMRVKWFLFNTVLCQVPQGQCVQNCHCWWYIISMRILRIWFDQIAHIHMIVDGDRVCSHCHVCKPTAVQPCSTDHSGMCEHILSHELSWVCDGVLHEHTNISNIVLWHIDVDSELVFMISYSCESNGG